ncbi:MAG: DUF3362 domain-containing protein, partial [Thiotrichaceae bacterium]
RTDLIGNGKKHLVPNFQPAGYVEPKRTFAKPVTKSTVAKTVIKPKYSKKTTAQWTTGSPSGRGKRR